MLVNIKKMKVKYKFILCNGCNYKYTITFTNKERVKESKCPNCKKINYSETVTRGEFGNSETIRTPVDVEDIISIHAQEFAEWCAKEEWEYYPSDQIWIGQGSYMNGKTTSELYTIFNNQNK
jgi:hypothetical protein